ncbi:MAG: NAD(P)-binding domain-containing protein [Anaerolineae bacterium]|jgi:thioredoxin reductase|nr:NAD(P)-binding domain-containing protein [Anaerolineae bacterium]
MLPVVVIGAGPVGLAAAAHLLERGMTPLVLEAGDQVGAFVREWAHVRMFSPWSMVVDAAATRLLSKHDWQMPIAEALPTGQELFDAYLQPLGVALSAYMRLNARVIAITRRDHDKLKDDGRSDAPFQVYLADDPTPIEAQAVIDASGTWGQPNPIGANGLPAYGETTISNALYYGMPEVNGKDRARYADRRVLVVGSGHSAVNALLDLVTLRQTAPDTTIWWAIRSETPDRVYGGGKADQLPARGQLGDRLRAHVAQGKVQILAPFRIHQVQPAPNGVRVIGTGREESMCIEVDEIIAATGARPNLAILREVRVEIDPSLESVKALAPLIDPNIHSCGTVPPHGEAELRQPEAGFYIVGMKSYGRAPTFLLATGYEQVRSIAAALSGDWEAAREVHLQLPETGVCCAPTNLIALNDL